MNTLDYLVLLVFTVGIMLTTIAFAKTGKNMKSFFAGGANVPWWISGLSLFMGFFSAGTFVVWGSIAYDLGFVSITILSTMCFSGFVVGIFIAPRWKKTAILTVGEYVANRLGKEVQKLYIYLFLLMGLIGSANVLYPVARILNAATHLDMNLLILIFGLMIIVYTTVGGLWAVMVSDVLQFFVLTIAVSIILPLTIKHVGGFEVFIDKAPKDFFKPFAGEFTAGFIVAFIFYHIILLAGNWPFVQRFTSVSSPKNARKVAILFGVLYIFSTIIWMLPPMMYKVINPTLIGNESEGAYLLVSKTVLPIGMLGLMLTAMIFATNSHANANLNLCSAVFANDIYKKIFPNTPEKKLMLVARLANVAFGLIIIAFALCIQFMGGIVEVVLSVAAIAGGALFLPPLWTLFSKYQTGKSIMAITLVSLFVGLFFKIITPAVFDFGLNRTQEMSLGVGLPIVLLAAFELYAISRKLVSPQYLVYIAIPKIESEESKADARKQNAHSLRIIAIALSMIAFLLFLISIFTNAYHWVLAAVALFIALISLSILFTVNKLKKYEKI